MKKSRRSLMQKHLDLTLPCDYTEAFRERILNLQESVKTDYLKEQFLSKFVSRDTSPASVRSARAEFKWLCAEQNNAATEDRLLTVHEEYNILPRVTYSTFVAFCQRLIVELLGEIPPQEALFGSFSGGASTSRTRAYSQPANKYYGEAHVTSAARDVFCESIAGDVPVWLNAQTSAKFNMVEVLGNVMFTVPKNTEIDRVAAKEPDLNMFLQKGLGSFIRRALKRVNVDLNDQSINRSLALRGSTDGSLATLDLSSASDSVTTELVYQLLPIHWFTLLDSVRSRVTTLLSGEEHRNCMFSSMGNGFTFELESLLFYVLVRATAYFTGTSGIVSVYGDDLIMPTQMASDAISVLEFFGFEVNTKKSFLSGPFRESCGGHYHNGFDITPFYVREPIDNLLTLIHTANQLREWASFRANGDLLSSILDPEVEAIWLWLKNLVPKRFWGGHNTSFKYQLVSYDTPHSRISQETDSKGSGDGGYVQWLNVTRDRRDQTDAVETSSYSRDLGRFRSRPVREQTVPRLEAHFVHEVC